MAQKQQAKHRELDDLKCRGAALDVGDLVLVKQTAWKGRHKIQDRWEKGEYRVEGQPTPGVPVCTVKSVAGGRTRVLHRNLLLPLQGKIRQPGGTEGEGISGSDEEKEGRDVMPKVARVPKGRPRSTTKPKSGPTQQKEASVVADASADLKASSMTIPSSPASISGDEDSDGEDDMYNTDSLTSHTTASNSTSADIPSLETSSNIPPSVSESKFRTIMPYLEETSQSDHASNSVFTEASTEHPSQHITDSPSLPSPPESPAPRRSARSMWGAPPVCFGKVIIHSSIVSEMAKAPTFRQTLFVSCMPNVIL